MYLYLSLGTTKAAAFVYHCGKKALQIVLALICLDSTSSPYFHIIYSTQQLCSHDTCLGTQILPLCLSTYHLPQHLSGNKVEPDSSSSAPQRTTPDFWGLGPIYSSMIAEALPLLKLYFPTILTPQHILPQICIRNLFLVSGLFSGYFL